uniref:TOD1/MUCI70 glycosyltransferase-like domain-containing protein n=1 Tax=Oryza punctata TaxID=4537 RepID=A0A0E0K580_ORYPU
MSLQEREETYYARNQTLHCGFVQGPEDYPNTGFYLDENDKIYMASCRVVVSSCIFGSSDYLRRPAKSKIGPYSKKNVCFVMFLDELTLGTLSEGTGPDETGFIGLWRIVVVEKLPYKDMRRAGKVPKFLAHRLFPSAIKLRLNADPMLIVEYFLWRNKAEYAISMHYDRTCVSEEVLQNKRLNKYNHTAIDEQFYFYQSDGLVKFNESGKEPVLPNVPEGSFIVRAHTPMSNLFSCLWFNEVNRFTSRDQLSFTYTYLKLRRMNTGKPFHLNMFKDVLSQVAGPSMPGEGSIVDQGSLLLARLVCPTYHFSSHRACRLLLSHLACRGIVGSLLYSHICGGFMDLIVHVWTLPTMQQFAGELPNQQQQTDGSYQQPLPRALRR